MRYRELCTHEEPPSPANYKSDSVFCYHFGHDVLKLDCKKCHLFVDSGKMVEDHLYIHNMNIELSNRPRIKGMFEEYDIKKLLSDWNGNIDVIESKIESVEQNIDKYQKKLTSLRRDLKKLNTELESERESTKILKDGYRYGTGLTEGQIDAVISFHSACVLKRQWRHENLPSIDRSKIAYLWEIDKYIPTLIALYKNKSITATAKALGTSITTVKNHLKGAWYMLIQNADYIKEIESAGGS